MSVKPELLKILVCPISKQPLHLAEEAPTSELNSRIRSGRARRVDGRTISLEAQSFLVTADGRVAYPVRDGIPVLIVEEGIELGE